MIPFDSSNARRTELLPNTPHNHPEASPVQIELSLLMNRNCNRVYYSNKIAMIQTNTTLTALKYI